MPYEAHTRYVFGGTIGPASSPVEEWSCTFNTDRITAPDSSSFENIVTEINAYLTSLESSISAGIHMTYVKQSLCDNTNHVVGDVFLEEGNLWTGSQAAFMPPQVALKMTLKAAGRGRSKYGGFYLPTLRIVLDPNTFEISSALALTFATATANFLEEVDGVLGGHAIVASGVLGNLPVVEARCGRALDTIRRRRNQLVEAYEISAVAP